jgi:hypothetical protein
MLLVAVVAAAVVDVVEKGALVDSRVDEGQVSHHTCEEEEVDPQESSLEDDTRDLDCH